MHSAQRPSRQALLCSNSPNKIIPYGPGQILCICTVPSGVDGGTASTENQEGLLKDLILQREKLILSIIFVLNQWPFFTFQARLGIPENILKYTTGAIGHGFYSLLQQLIS